MVFLTPNKQCQSTEGNWMLISWFVNTSFKPQGCGHYSTKLSLFIYSLQQGVYLSTYMCVHITVHNCNTQNSYYNLPLYTSSHSLLLTMVFAGGRVKNYNKLLFYQSTAVVAHGVYTKPAQSTYCRGDWFSQKCWQSWQRKWLGGAIDFYPCLQEARPGNRSSRVTGTSPISDSWLSCIQYNTNLYSAQGRMRIGGAT